MSKLSKEDLANFKNALKTSTRKDRFRLFYINIFNPNKRNRIFKHITNGMSVMGAIKTENPK